MHSLHQGSLRILKALNRAGNLQISLVSVTEEKEREEAERYLRDLNKEGGFREGYDLLILKTRVRIGSDRLFLGPRVERLLELAPCPVIVLNL
jgi:nucleotide-binding universal stress UspA family protein